MMKPTNSLMKSAVNTKFFLIISVFLLMASHAKASEVMGVTFAKSFNDEGIHMQLQGTGLKTVAFFKAFAAGFYQFNPENREVVGEVPKRIEVEYFVNIPGKKLNAYTIERIKVNVDQREFERIQDEIKEMAKYFVDLKPGDRFSLTYIPGIGTKFAHNDQLTGIIEGDEFAKALFSVWIGEKPFDKRLKNQILGMNTNQKT
jgi:hypothetical protein